jgi:hypothetical protein
MGQWTRLAQLTQRASAGVFGEPATLTIGSTEYEIKGEFDAGATREAIIGDGLVMVDEPARISVRSEQFSGASIVVRQSTVEVRGTTYTIIEARPDGAGGLVLILGR